MRGDWQMLLEDFYNRYTPSRFQRPYRKISIKMQSIEKGILDQ